MTTKGWRPLSHLSRDFGIAIFSAVMVCVIQYLASNDFFTSSPTKTSRGVILMGVGAISGTLTGTSIVAMTIVVGWWKVGRLNSVTSIPAYGDTMLLLLRATTWILAFLAVLSVFLAALPLSPNVETFVISLYVAVVATALNYIRRTIKMLYSAAALVTKMVED